jgi:hypothetical protein
MSEIFDHVISKFSQFLHIYTMSVSIELLNTVFSQ